MNSRGLSTAAIAALTLAASASAQTQAVLAPLNTNPVQAVSGAVTALPTYYYNLQTGEGSFKSDQGSQRALATCYSNSAFSGSFATVPIGSEWIDWGDKGCATTSLVGGLTVGYATTAADPLPKSRGSAAPTSRACG